MLNTCLDVAGTWHKQPWHIMLFPADILQVCIIASSTAQHSKAAPIEAVSHPEAPSTSRNVLLGTHSTLPEVAAKESTIERVTPRLTDKAMAVLQAVINQPCRREVRVERGLPYCAITISAALLRDNIFSFLPSFLPTFKHSLPAVFRQLDQINTAAECVSVCMAIDRLLLSLPHTGPSFGTFVGDYRKPHVRFNLLCQLLCFLPSKHLGPAKIAILWHVTQKKRQVNVPF